MIGWRFIRTSVGVLTHRSCVEIPLRITRHYTSFLYGGWRVSQEIRLGLAGRRAIVWLTFEKDVEVDTREGNYLSIDVNENNVAVAVVEGLNLERLGAMRLA